MKTCGAIMVSKDGMTGKHRSSRGEGGFTLVEMLVAMGVGMVMLAAVASVFTLQNKTLSSQEDMVELQQNVRAAMDIMTSDIGMAGYDLTRVNDTVSANNFVGVATMSATQIRIQADLDGSGAINAASQENLTYSFDTTDTTNKKIRRDSGAGAQPFMEHAENLAFAYLDGQGNVTAAPARVRRIRITITGRTTKPDPQYPLNGGYRTYTLTSVVSPRNLAY
ncbi:MAG: PilW family protein [Syntrophales bacterium]